MVITIREGALPVLKQFNPSPPPYPRTFTVAFESSKLARIRSPSLEKTRERAITALVFGSRSLGSLRGGTGLLERPGFDQSQFDPVPQVQEGGDRGQLHDKRGLGSGDSYKVLLIDHDHHTEKLVVKALPQAVPKVTIDDARELFHESRQKGAAVVIVTVKEHAEFYAQMMLRRGLQSAIEPDSNTA
ncbi:ATP-dependent Clp protease adapter protein CLPS2, chloroplastic-like [Phoenix dactylifera]|uniref:ATP-dependent Clp protease adapter protein CLPS2, chloroplastic-like n=1 Tax=Phoenix dactylifera TaxID=42345 RepID=A0A8B7BF35_PHODC|nr:ATP-dependent Clp protease adapter protein CLPS2, chloroplastic-like [Phoenix dactylifera]